MSLVISNFETGLLSALLLGVAPPPANAPSDVIAVAIAAAYDSYASQAQSCSGLNPTVVNFAGLEDGLKDALAGSNPDGQAAAEKWHDALAAYSTGALFGATGAVISITGGATFKTNLAGVFDNLLDLMPLKANQMSGHIDAYTKSVMVQDTAVPPPSGCGPAAIY